MFRKLAIAITALLLTAGLLQSVVYPVFQYTRYVLYEQKYTAVGTQATRYQSLDVYSSPRLIWQWPKRGTWESLRFAKAVSGDYVFCYSTVSTHAFGSSQISSMIMDCPHKDNAYTINFRYENGVAPIADIRESLKWNGLIYFECHSVGYRSEIGSRQDERSSGLYLDGKKQLDGLAVILDELLAKDSKDMTTAQRQEQSRVFHNRAGALQRPSPSDGSG